MKAKAIQICGTGSDVGKSIIVSALCRILKQDGYNVAPFKAQNMALNSYVTSEGGEIGRAQAEQAYAARIAPSVDINPILLKPNSDTKAQVIVGGRPTGNMDAARYARYKSRLFKKVIASYDRLSKNYNMIIIEGAGSPAEVNLKKHDIVNLKMAEYAEAEVILVGDIDKGGVFASLIGTLELLDKNERDRIKGFIINKFRGDKRLLKGGIRFLEKRTGKKVLGVVPYFKDIHIGEEDSVCLEDRPASKKKRTLLDIAVICLPHMSNFTDFDALENESDVNLYYVHQIEGLGSPDVIILPGTKNVIADLKYLAKSGFVKKILTAYNSQPKTVLVGICGGFQMLGRKVSDPHNIESHARQTKGLSLFDMTTGILKRKQTYQVEAYHSLTGAKATGYEIHHGKTIKSAKLAPAFVITKRGAKYVNICDGAQDYDGRVWGTYIHGVFDSKDFRRQFLRNIMQLKGSGNRKIRCNNFDKDKEFDKLAKLVRDNIDINYLYKIVKLERR